MQKRFKLISVLLLFTLFFTLLPTPILAQGIINTINEQNIINTPPMENIKKPEPKIVHEVNEKRDKFTKHYIREDNTFEADEYPTAVHYKSQGK